MKKNFLMGAAALAMAMGSTAPVFAEETKNDPTTYTVAQEGDYKTYDQHDADTNDKVSGNAATTNKDGAVSKLDGQGENAATEAGGDKKSAELIYQVAEGYTWTIHSLVDFGDSKGINNTSTVKKNAAITVPRNVIGDGKKLSITLDPANDYKVHNGNTALSYTVANATDGAFTVENHPIAGLTIKSDGTMVVSIATNFAFISGKTSMTDHNSYGYEFEETDYNPNYTNYKKYTKREKTNSLLLLTLL